MNLRQLGDSDLRVSEICLGTWTTFGGSLPDDDAVALVDAAFELGINFFDTANVYSAGRSEEVLGRALANRPRDSYVVATKVFAPAPDGGRGLSREQILKQIDASLERLGMDFVDLYQCHSFDDEVPVEETLGALTARRGTSASRTGAARRSVTPSTSRASTASRRSSPRSRSTRCLRATRRRT